MQMAETREGEARWNENFTTFARKRRCFLKKPVTFGAFALDFAQGFGARLVVGQDLFTHTPPHPKGGEGNADRALLEPSGDAHEEDAHRPNVQHHSAAMLPKGEEGGGDEGASGTFFIECGHFDGVFEEGKW